MPNNLYNQNFLESPDPVTGVQRRTGQNFLDLKQTVHERRTLEHNYDPDETTPQVNHGIHRMGSAVAYVTADGEPQPTDRPTGKDKNADEILAVTLGEADKGRLLISEDKDFYYWSGTAWVKIDTNPIGFIQMWVATNGLPSASWLKCDGTATYLVADYPDLGALLGSQFGGDGISTFGVPNMQGISVVGAGTQEVNGRAKGSSSRLPGTIVEDAIQTFTGSWAGNGVYAEGNIINEFAGIFKTYTGSGGSRAVDRTSPTDPNYGAQIDLTAAGVRNTTETRVSAMAVDYYIKAR